MPTAKANSGWIVVTVLTASVTVLLGYRLLHPPAPLPTTLRELSERLSQQEPPLYVVLSSANNPEMGFYVCTTTQPWEQLARLHRSVQEAGKWQGVVYCERIGNLSRIFEEDIESWGEHCMRIGTFLFFGDPALLLRIRETIRAL